jgi:hypothetical protein
VQREMIVTVSVLAIDPVGAFRCLTIANPGFGAIWLRSKGNAERLYRFALTHQSKRPRRFDYHNAVRLDCVGLRRDSYRVKRDDKEKRARHIGLSQDRHTLNL